MRNYSTLQYFLPVFLALFMFGCKDPEPEPTPKDGLVVTIQEEFTNLPANVSVFFHVRTKDDLPVAGLTESNFTIYEKGRNDAEPREISEFEAERRISDNSQVFAYSTILLLDLSGSVTDQSLAELKEASKSFVDAILPEGASGAYYMGIWWFDGEDELHPLVPFTINRNELISGINSVTADMSNDNSTDLFGAVIKGAAIADQELTFNEAKNILAASSVVTFTDGTDQAGRYASQEAYNAISNARDGVNFFTIGLGGEIDNEVLKSLGPNGMAFAADKAQLVEKFEEIGSIVWSEANSYYLFEYCSPKRDGSGVNELTIKATKDGQSGSESTTFDATGFTGGCSL